MNLKSSSFPVLLVILVFGAAPTFAQLASAPDFSYNGNLGPGFWNEINPACAATPTARQSPIDIRDVKYDRTLTPLDLVLNETSFTLTNPGYTVEATPRSPGFITVDGVMFKMKQFHFHTFSEHTINGRHSGMELHMVFEDASEHYAVIGVLYKLGRANQFLEKLLNAGLPEKTSSPAVTIQALNAAEALTDTSSYYTYPGSFTTPPCSEVVTWFVLKQEAQLSAEQLKAFHRILGNDFRPTQDLNKRVRVIRATPRRRNSEDNDSLASDSQ